MTLSLNIGSNPIALVQSGPALTTSASRLTLTLPAPSSPGTALVAFLGSVFGGSGGTAKIGQQSAATFSFDYSLANTDNQVFMGPYTMPEHGTITSLSVNMGGHSAAVTARLVIWSGSGAVAGYSNSFSAAAGHSLVTKSLSAPIDAPSGSSWFIGFWRAPAGSGEWGVTSSGSFKTKTNTSGNVGSVSGYTNCSSPYVCGNMQAYAQYNIVVSGGSITAAAPGWTLLETADQAGLAHNEWWVYLTNPGGISTIPFDTTSTGVFQGAVSEWANVAAVTAVDTSGTATATSGTTLTPSTDDSVQAVNELALSGWLQYRATSSSVTFTSPAGWTRLADDSSNAQTSHFATEYLLNPPLGALSPTLTVNVTVSSAAGATIVLKAAPPITVDQSAYLVYGSLSLKLNTLDFELIDCPTVIQLMSTVILSDPGNYPDWTGTIAQAQARDVVNIQSGHHFQVITATNTQPPTFGVAPFELTDNPAPNTADAWLLENGDIWELENGSGAWLMESSIQENSYNSLSIGSQVGSTSPSITLTTLGYLTVPASIEQPNAVNLWPGMTFKLTSSNLANWITAPGGLYTITSITITYQGANPPLPVYQIQFGDQILTLADWVRTR